MLKDERIYRSTLRGLKKCPSCDYYNGNRAKGCVNKNCPLHFLKKLKKQRVNSIDPIQLITHNDTRIYSVRIKEREREPLHRNFVQIIDTTLSSDQSGSIISRNAICYVDTCKYDSNDINLSCKHVKGATTECQIYAQEIKITKDILYNLKINNDVKTNLWDLYSCNELIVPPVQRINKSTFVIKCAQNINFPAGRLHVNVKPDDEDGDFDYVCACKKLKILVSPNDTVVLENDVCDHMLLLLAGVLSSQHLQNQFQNLLNAFKTLWDQNDLHAFDSDFFQNGDFYNFTEGILNSVIKLDNDESFSNIFQNDDNANFQITNDNEDANQDMDEIQLINMASATAAANALNNIVDSGIDPSPTPLTTDSEYLELSDCQIELMDQFKLTDQIDLCSNNYEILMNNADDLLELEKDNMNLIDGQTALFQNGESNETTATTAALDANKKSLNQIKVNGANKNRRQRHENNNCLMKRKELKEQKEERQSLVLEFNEWLKFVIEQINMSIDANTKDTSIKHVFSTKTDFFECLSTKFSINGKRRIPNETVIIKKGKLKGLSQSKWIFTSSAIIQRIFSTKELQIENERSFMKDTDGSFKLYDESCESISVGGNANKKFKRILPNLICAYIKFDTNSKEEKNRNAFIIEWIPNVFPKSRFGIMKIEFSIGFKKSKKSQEQKKITLE